MWTGQLPEKLASVTALAFAPDGFTLYTGDTKGWILAWNLATREPRELFRVPVPDYGNRGVYKLWPTPDGSRLLVPELQGLFDAFRPAAGPLLTTGESGWGHWRYLFPDGKRVITCEPEWRVGLWNLETDKRLKVPGPLGNATAITSYELLPDGVTLLTYQTSGNQLTLWNFPTGEKVGELTPTGSGINPSTLSKDGTTFAVGRRGKLWVYDVPSRQLRHQMKFEKDFRFLAFQPNSALLASASTNSVVTIWDTTAGQRVKQLDWKIGQIKSLLYAPDGLTCAVGGFEKFVVFDVDME